MQHRTLARARKTPSKPIGRFQTQAKAAGVDMAPPAHNRVLQLQRQFGNRAVRQFMGGENAPARQPVKPGLGHFPFVQRVKLANTKHIKGLLEQEKADKKQDPFSGLVGDLRNDRSRHAAAEIDLLSKHDLIELLDDINLEQLAALERLIPGLTAKIDALFRPDTPYRAAKGKFETIAGIGEFEVVPDGTNIGLYDFGTITQSDFGRLQTDWHEIQAGGKILIMEVNDLMVPVPAFRAKVLAALGTLLLRPTGRAIVRALKNDANYTMIKPAVISTVLTPARGGVPMGQEVLGNVAAATPFSAAAYNNVLMPGGPPKEGAGSTIEIDPSLNDDTLKAYDIAKRPLKTPVFLALGHELAHALHNAQGVNKAHLPAGFAYPNMEEKMTIEGEENRMRLEHLERRLGKRFGHAGSDNRVKLL